MDYDKTLEYWEELQKPLPGWCNRPAVIEDLIVIMFKIYQKHMYNKYTRMSIAWKKWWQYFYYFANILMLREIVDTMTKRIKRKAID